MREPKTILAISALIVAIAALVFAMAMLGEVLIKLSWSLMPVTP